MKPLVFARGGRLLEVKHSPGGHQHNQETHGDWSDGIPNVPNLSGDSSAPPTGKPAPKKAALKPDTVSSMSTRDLEAVMVSGDLYDMATIEAVADELDKRDDIDARTREFNQYVEPGSPQEHALFDSLIPDRWARWAGQAKPRKQSKADEIKALYQDFADAQHDRFLSQNRPFFKREYKDNPPFNAEGWFMGEARLGNQLVDYGSEELQRFFAEDPPMTLSDFKAEFYPSYARAKAQVGSRYLSEHG